MALAKLSITIDESDLKWVRAEAKRLTRSVSAVVSDVPRRARLQSLSATFPAFPTRGTPGSLLFAALPTLETPPKAPGAALQSRVEPRTALSLKAQWFAIGRVRISQR